MSKIGLPVRDASLHTLNRTVNITEANELACEPSDLGWVEDTACRGQCVSKCPRAVFS